MHSAHLYKSKLVSSLWSFLCRVIFIDGVLGEFEGGNAIHSTLEQVDEAPNHSTLEVVE